MHRPGLAACAADLAGHVLDGVAAARRDDDRGSFGGEGMRDRGADPLAAAGHDGDRAVKSPH